MTPPAVERLASRLVDLVGPVGSSKDRRPSRPQIVAIDGRSGAGKSTLAVAVAAAMSDGALTDGTPIEVSVIEGDDFYAGGSPEDWDAMSAAQKVDHVIDWRRQRPVLEQLRRGQEATWHPYDWLAFDGRLDTTADTCPPTPIAIMEGAYSARPELADLVDLRVLLEATAEVRHAQLVEREGEAYVDDWYRRWDEAEQLYFGEIMTSDRFDLVL